MKVFFVKKIEQPRPEGATCKAREKRPGDEVASRQALVLKGFPFENDLIGDNFSKDHGTESKFSTHNKLILTY